MANALSPVKEFEFPSSAIKGQRLPVASLFQTLKPAICFLLDKGIKMLVVTLGPDGVILCIREWPRFKNLDLKSSKMTSLRRIAGELVKESSYVKQNCAPDSRKLGVKYYALHFPALHASVVNLTGAGDSLVGGILASICSGLDLLQSMAVGIAVAKAAVESEINVPAEFHFNHIAGM